MTFKLHAAGAALATLLLAAGCGKNDKPTTTAPPPLVGVHQVQAQRHVFSTELPGRTSARQTAEIRPQVGGILQRRLFEEGATVKAGQPLYQIDPASYQAAVASAQATLAKAEASLNAARVTAQRNSELAKLGALSQQLSDDSQAALQQADAELAVARAALQTARINLERTRITAPIAGRVELSSVTPGSLLTANQAEALTTVQQLDPLYVDIVQSSAELLRLKRELADGSQQAAGKASEAPIRLLLEDGSAYPHAGRLQFSGVTVNRSTGAVTLRALVPNPEGLLMPGMYVRALVQTGINEQAILVPQQGIARAPNGEASALVVDANNKVERRAVTVDRAVGNRWQVTAGLKAGEQLIVEGLQSVKVGAPVRPVPAGSKPARGAGKAAPAASAASAPAKGSSAMARFFIDRPIFAWVIAIVIMLAGGLSVHLLPLEQYPDIAPTRVSINATYNGASAQTIEDSVTQIIEQRLKGLDRLVSMESTSSSSGSANVQLSFEAGTDPDVAQMQVQNKLQQALSQLPQAVQDRGVSVTKAGTDLLMVVSLISEDGRLTATDLGDYIASSLQDVISRVDGVGDVNIQGTGYAMRVWLDPAKLNQYALMPSDVRAALIAQNTEVSAGQIGALPAPPGQQLNATITARSKLQTVEQFRNVVLKASSDGAVVRLGDVARVELGSDSYNTRARLAGQNAAGMQIFLATGANALGTAEAVRKKLDELAPFFPSGIKAVVSFDTTPFVKVSIEGVVKTLIEAMVLVVLIMYLFMQNLRATLIPAIAVPVVLLGTFGILAAFGYSINTLTMFGLVLAIGLLVDDAIVVVENVERLMSEEGLSPLEATRQSMGEITGALVGIALVLSAVFIPMAFFGGSTGVIYRQFSITIVSAMLLSVLVAVTLTPALCATLLKPVAKGEHHHPGGLLGPVLGRFFDGFNRMFDRNADRYRSGVAGLFKRSGRSLLVYALLLGAAALLYRNLPTSFLPEEDQGTLQIQVRMPPGATNERLRASMEIVEAYLAQQDDVLFYNLVTGQGGDQGSGQGFIRLKDWSLRTGKSQGAAEMARRFSRELQAQVRDAQVFILLPPAVRGLGANAGFAVQLQDVGGLGPQALAEARDRFLELANARPELSRVRNNNLGDTPQFNIQIDDRKAGALGLSTASINDTLASAMGGAYVNDFIDRGRVKRVYIQGDAAFRMEPESIKHWYVRNNAGEMVPFSAFASASWQSGPRQLKRYNGMSAYELIGDAAPGVSSGTAMAIIEEIMAEMPKGIGFEWAGRSYQERLSGSQAPALYAISILFVFLCLAALYESWSVPFSVMLVVPLGILGALIASTLGGQSNDVYFQVGLLTTVGLSAKNAILIVEFAKTLQEQGMDLIEATLKAARQRLRPILMTSLAFMFGVLPLALASGAGSGSQRSIGFGVLGGMASATVLGIFFVPIFYVLIRGFFARRAAARQGAQA